MDFLDPSALPARFASVDALDEFLTRPSRALVDTLAAGGAGDELEGGLKAPMPGKVIALLATPGASVDKGAPLLVLEAMKMEHTITAPGKGTVRSFHYAAGDQVAEGAELVDFEPAA